MRLAAVSLLGLALFAWPFAGHDVPGYAPAAAVATAAVAALVFMEAATRRLDARRLALLAALAALDSALRLALVTGIGGFSPVFLPILCAGYALGAEFGFLCGAMALAVSALVTGGVGPWLPYQVFAAGWVGAAAGLAGARRHGPAGLRDMVVLGAVGVACGFGFGALMDTWDWATFYRDAPDYGWQPGLAPAEALARFSRFYLATSAVYDSFRAVGNLVLVAVFAVPVIAALDRVRSRLSFSVVIDSPG